MAVVALPLNSNHVLTNSIRVAAFLIAASIAGPCFAEPSGIEKSGRIQNSNAQWGLNCDPQQRCELAISLKDQNGPISHILIYEVGQKKLLEYLVPLRVNLQKGITLLVDRKKRFETKPLYCDTAGCVGYSPLSPDLLSALRAGKTLELVFQAINDKQVYALPFTLSGFTVKEKQFQIDNNR